MKLGRILLLGTTLTGLAWALWLSQWPYPIPSTPGSLDHPQDTDAAERNTPDKQPHTDMPPARAVALIAPHPLNAHVPTGHEVSRPSKPPNVLMFIVCTLRKDQVSVYGGPPAASPTFARLAREGTVFDDLITATPWTKPAITALLTSQHAIDVGMVEPSGKRNDLVLAPTVPTLATLLHDAGYLTIGGSGNPYITETYGFARGFDTYQFGLDPDWRDKITGRALVNASLETLDKARHEGHDQPFLIQLVILDAHAHRTAPQSEWSAYAEPDVPWRIAQYRAHLKRVDEALALMLDGLESRHELDNTVVVVVGDHGEGMYYPGNHGKRHGLYFGSATTYVPWIMRGPGVAQGHTVLGTASGIDVLPTLLGTIGVPAPTSATGRDLSDFVRAHAQVIPTEPVFSDTWFAAGNRAAIFLPDRMCAHNFRESDHSTDFVNGCFDRHKDPLFLSPFEDGALLDQLLAWRAQRNPSQGTKAQVGEGQSAQLRALGYVDVPDEN